MMNINRHNYEEFFLLYTDRELTPAERMAVEQFVQENPDLADEFVALQQTTLPADENILMDKSVLYRHAEEEIGVHNYTEQFLLYVDNELSAAEQETVETFVLQHPELQETFMQLKQSKLPAETIVFPYKDSLYRTESDQKPVLYMRWMRMVAAAAVIGFGFFLWTLTGDNTGSTNSSNNGQLAAVTEKKSVGAGNTDYPVPVKEPIVAESGNASFSNDLNKTDEQNSMAVLQKSVAVNVPVVNTREEMNTKPELVIERQAAITTEESAKPAIGTRSLTGITAGAAINENEMIRTAASPDAEEGAEKQMLTQQVVYKELDTESDSENKSLFIGAVEINKDKLRGLFRKAGSIFRSRKAEEAANTGTSTTKSLK